MRERTRGELAINVNTFFVFLCFLFYLFLLSRFFAFKKGTEKPEKEHGASLC